VPVRHLANVAIRRRCLACTVGGVVGSVLIFYPVNMSEFLLHSAIRTLVSTCLIRESLSIGEKDPEGVSIQQAWRKGDNYLEVLNDGIDFDIGFVVTEGVFELRRVVVSKAHQSETSLV